MRSGCRLLLMWIVLASAPLGFAEGCAVCGNHAASAPASQQRGLRRGIVVLLLPTMSILGAFGVLLYRNRR